MPLLSPRSQPDHAMSLRDDGTWLMTLLPGDGVRVEWSWNIAWNPDERLPVGEPFVWEIEAGVIKSDVPAGHEWCLWQWHSPNDPDMVGANPPLMLVMKDGLARIQIHYEHSQPFDKSKKRSTFIAENIRMQLGKLYRWHVEAKIAEDGFVKVRRDGVLLADYVGPVGYHMTGKPYAKAGIYKWKPLEWAGEIKALIRF